jgi:chromosome segregation ATPase
MAAICQPARILDITRMEERELRRMERELMRATSRLDEKESELKRAQCELKFIRGELERRRKEITSLQKKLDGLRKDEEEDNIIYGMMVSAIQADRKWRMAPEEVAHHAEPQRSDDQSDWLQEDAASVPEQLDSEDPVDRLLGKMDLEREVERAEVQRTERAAMRQRG